MSEPKTSEKSVYLDREEHFHKGTVGGKIVVPYYYNAGTDTLSPASSETTDTKYATKITESGTATYIAKATPGSAQSSAVWQVQKIDESSGTVITWADGNANFDNVATDLTALTYS